MGSNDSPRAPGRHAGPPERSAADRVAIVGAGALGTLLASRLAATVGPGRAPVLVLVRGDARAAALRREAPAARTVTDPALLREADLLFLCVKSYQTEAAAAMLATAGLAGNSGDIAPAIVSLQNGWGHMEIVGRALPASPLVAGTTTLGAFWDEREIFHPSVAGLTTFAPWNDAAVPACDRAAAIFREAGLRAETGKNARDALWRKLVLNVAVNPLTAVHGVRNGALLDSPPLHALAVAAAGEAVAVGTARGHLAAAYDPEPLLDVLLRDTASNRSSMAEDVERGRPTEADAIVGALIREGAAAGVPTPVTASLAERLKALAPAD